MLTLESALLATSLLDQTEGCYPGMPHLSLCDDPTAEALPAAKVSVEYVFDPTIGEHVMRVQHHVSNALNNSNPL